MPLGENQACNRVHVADCASVPAPANDNASEVRALIAAHHAQGLLPNDIESIQLVSTAFAAALARNDSAAAYDVLRQLRARGESAAQMLDFVEQVFGPDTDVELRAISPAGRGAWSFTGRTGHERERMAAFLRDHDGRDGLYIGVNPRTARLRRTGQAGNAQDTALRRFVVFDFDNKDAPADDPAWSTTVERLRAFNPLAILNSGNGMHVWFEIEPVVDPIEIAVMSEPLRDLMGSVGADTSMADAPRVARLPASINIPNERKRGRGARPVLTHLVHGPDPERRVWPWHELDRAIRQAFSLPAADAPGNAERFSTGSSIMPATVDRAPSCELLIAALDLIPNDAATPRDFQVDLAHAVRGASEGTDFEAEAKEAFMRWSAKYPGADPDADARLYDTIRETRRGWRHIMADLAATNPVGHTQVRAEAARHAFAQAAAVNRQTLSAAAQVQPVAPFQPKQIPPRRWLYGRSVIAGFVSGLVSPGGAGKSALVMARGVAMATGRELLAGEKPIGPMTVLYHNAEDGMDEQLRRLAGVMDRYGIQHADLGDRLILTSGRDLPLRFARMGKEGPEAIPGAVDWFVDTIKAHGVEVVILDPIGAMHGLPENANEAMNFLAGMLRDIIERTGVAMVVLHHTSKAAATDMDAAGAGAARGASAFTDFLRVQEQVVRMTSQEAPRMGVADSERRSFMRVETGKANLSRAEEASWVRLSSVKLHNGNATYPDGDEVVVVERWTPPTAMLGTASDLARVQAAIGAASVPPRLDIRSTDWVGWLVAHSLGLDAGGPSLPARNRTPGQAANYTRVRTLVDGWLLDGGFVRQEKRDEKSRKTVQCVGIGTPAILSDLDALGASS